MIVARDQSSLKSMRWPFCVQAGDSRSTIAGTTSSGAFSVSGSSPGIALARIAVRVGPGLNRFTLILVFSHSSA